MKNKFSKLEIVNAIKQTRQEYRTKGLIKKWCEINSGLCEDFASDVLDKLGISDELYPIGYEELDMDDDIGGHVFLQWRTAKGKYLYFDAECPNGVKDPLSLPFALRYYKSIKKNTSY